MEVWKEAKGFLTRFEISNYGRVRTKHTSRGVYGTEYRYLKPRDNGSGYMQFRWLGDDGKKRCVYVHRLVAELFVENPRGLPEINHINENKADNRAVNLEWCTHVENCRYGTRIERTAIKHRKAVICVETKKVYKSIKEAAGSVGVGITAVSNCLNGRTETCAGYHWGYVNV